MNFIKLFYENVKVNGLKLTFMKIGMMLKGKEFSNTKLQKINEDYAKWIEKNEPNEKELKLQKNYEFKIKPKISVVVPMYNTKIDYFTELVDSLINQTYLNWELCLADRKP